MLYDEGIDRSLLKKDLVFPKLFVVSVLFSCKINRSAWFVFHRDGKSRYPFHPDATLLSGSTTIGAIWEGQDNILNSVFCFSIRGNIPKGCCLFYVDSFAFWSIQAYVIMVYSLIDWVDFFPNNDLILYHFLSVTLIRLDRIKECHKNKSCNHKHLNRLRFKPINRLNNIVLINTIFPF